MATNSPATQGARTFLAELELAVEDIEIGDTFGGLHVSGKAIADHRDRPAYRFQLDDRAETIKRPNVGRLVLNEDATVLVERGINVSSAEFNSSGDLKALLQSKTDHRVTRVISEITA